ncbi:MAG TPA: preprotein translocase subunit SecG [Clostridia bacterium]|nr:preprotein translocase subunit SecG [Clostridia bacterium]
MFILITIIHVVVCLFLIAVVLLQSGKSADIAAAFGGMGSQTAFGPRSAANALTKATTWAAVIFMLTSFTLAIVATRNTGTSSSGSVLGNTKSAPVTNAPAPSQQTPAPEPQPMTPSR